MRALADLWAGRLPLAEAFWKHGVLIGLGVNVAATGCMLTAVSAGLPGWLALAIHLCPLPYTAACVVGVWRSAARHPGPARQADAARAAMLIWAAVLVLV